ncbi:hypothetical protein NDU88_000449 [Pleurodeles waltl]|uniref:Transmembrane protein n=1 Tax=Pleurodeles waltl TaxID=8319 RepID=A0AAV7LY68_PLEWA|nr:hypothetical protein NDU88_000449 [Pleurodeles waltl]
MLFNDAESSALDSCCSTGGTVRSVIHHGELSSGQLLQHWWYSPLCNTLRRAQHWRAAAALVVLSALYYAVESTGQLLQHWWYSPLCITLWRALDCCCSTGGTVRSVIRCGELSTGELLQHWWYSPLCITPWRAQPWTAAAALVVQPSLYYLVESSALDSCCSTGGTVRSVLHHGELSTGQLLQHWWYSPLCNTLRRAQHWRAAAALVVLSALYYAVESTGELLQHWWYCPLCNTLRRALDSCCSTGGTVRSVIRCGEHSTGELLQHWWYCPLCITLAAVALVVLSALYYAVESTGLLLQHWWYCPLCITLWRALDCCCSTGGTVRSVLRCGEHWTAAAALVVQSALYYAAESTGLLLQHWWYCPLCITLRRAQHWRAAAALVVLSALYYAVETTGLPLQHWWYCPLCITLWRALDCCCSTGGTVRSVLRCGEHWTAAAALVVLSALYYAVESTGLLLQHWWYSPLCNTLRRALDCRCSTGGTVRSVIRCGELSSGHLLFPASHLLAVHGPWSVLHRLSSSRPSSVFGVCNCGVWTDV